MGAAIGELPRMYFVAGVVFRYGGGTHKEVYRSKSRIDWNLIQGDSTSPQLDAGAGMTHV